MKRNLTIAVASIALIVPAIALGQGGAHAVYEGHLIGARDSAVKLKESFGDLERAVKVFTVRDYEVQCKGGVPGTLKRTKLRARPRSTRPATSRPAATTGARRSSSSGHIGVNKATGTFRITGRLKADNGQTLDCDSGKLEWKVRP